MQTELQNQRSPPIPSLTPVERPPAVLFYRWWCGLFVAIYLGMSLYEILVAVGRVEPSLGLIESAVNYENDQARDEIIAGQRREAPGDAVFTTLVAAIYGFAAIVPRKPWAWIFGLVVICTTIFPFVVTAAGTIPLVIFWAKPATKTYFNRR